MKVIYYFGLLLCLTVISCEKSQKSNKIESGHFVKTGNKFSELIRKLQPLQVGYRYNLVSQDHEGCYQSVLTDEPYFSEYTWIMGYLQDTSHYCVVLYLEAGDDLYPSLKVFSKSGEAISSKTVSYANCAAGDCGMKECVSVVEIVDKYSLERSLTMSSVECDSLGKETAELKNLSKKQTIMVDQSGQITFGETK